MRRGVLEWPVPGWIDPAAVFSALFAESESSFWLDCGPDAARGISAMGTADHVLIESPDCRVLDELERELALEAGPADTADGFRLGWVCCFGYGLRQQTMGDVPLFPSRHPDAFALRADRAIVFDHGRGALSLLVRGEEWGGEAAAWRDSTLAALASVGGAPEPLVPQARRARWRESGERYVELVRECQAAITAGDAYQLCLTSEVAVDGVFDPVETYVAMRVSSPSQHGGFVRAGGVALLSASPETFLAVSPTGFVETSPIKGTRPRGMTPQRDDELREELLASEKERAENLMIVDLMRNDLSRVCELGTVAVTGLLEVASHTHVHQLVSTIRGRLRRGLGVVDAVRACFPAGSMTGAPKLSAVRILERLEARPRGLYSGAFGYVGLDGRAQLAMVIRSIVIDRDGATVGAGGGITALSVADEELAEARLKAAALLAVLGAG